MFCNIKKNQLNCLCIFAFIKCRIFNVIFYEIAIKKIPFVYLSHQENVFDSDFN